MTLTMEQKLMCLDSSCKNWFRATRTDLFARPKSLKVQLEGMSMPIQISHFVYVRGIYLLAFLVACKLKRKD